MEHAMMKIRAKNTHLPLKAVPGHFATNHAHINYYIDMTTIYTETGCGPYQLRLGERLQKDQAQEIEEES